MSGVNRLSACIDCFTGVFSSLAQYGTKPHRKRSRLRLLGFWVVPDREDLPARRNARAWLSGRRHRAGLGPGSRSGTQHCQIERRTTALHPTRSGVIGLIASALGINKHDPDEVEQIARFASLNVTTVPVPRNKPRGGDLPIRRWRTYRYRCSPCERQAGERRHRADVSSLPSRCPLRRAARRFGVLVGGSRRRAAQSPLSSNTARIA